MIDITVIILTKNEAKNIVQCLMSIKNFAKRVVVIDSGSTDNTVDIAKEMGADIYIHPFLTYAQQFNWGIDNVGINTKWTFRLDADERLTPELCAELEILAKKHEVDDVNGIVMEAWLYFMNRKIKHGGRNKRKLMMFKTGIGRIENRKMDEHTILKQGTIDIAKNRFIHYDYKNMTHWINKMNWYASREIQDYYSFKDNPVFEELKDGDSIILGTRRKKFQLYYQMPLFFRSWLLFIYNYVFRLGFLDGKEGFIYHYMYHRWYRLLVDAKILEHEINKGEFEMLRDLIE